MLPSESRSVGGRFTLVRQLGGGGMGIVYEAIDRSSGRHVALKTMRVPTGDALLRFKQEFRSLQGVHHPNLITLGDLFVESGQWWFSMELVRGVNFLAHVRPVVASIGPDNAQSAFCETAPQTALEPRAAEQTPHANSMTQQSGAGATASRIAPTPTEEALPFDEARLRGALQQIVEGLHALHLANKVHRDVKPDNVPPIRP